MVGGIPTPLKNDGVRQLGWLFHSQLNGKSYKSMVPNHKPVYKPLLLTIIINHH